jgi:hypothetical protein
MSVWLLSLEAGRMHGFSTITFSVISHHRSRWHQSKASNPAAGWAMHQALRRTCSTTVSSLGMAGRVVSSGAPLIFSMSRMPSSSCDRQGAIRQHHLPSIRLLHMMTQHVSIYSHKGSACAVYTVAFKPLHAIATFLQLSSDVMCAHRITAKIDTMTLQVHLACVQSMIRYGIQSHQRR